MVVRKDFCYPGSTASGHVLQVSTTWQLTLVHTDPPFIICKHPLVSYTLLLPTRWIKLDMDKVRQTTEEDPDLVDLVQELQEACIDLDYAAKCNSTEGEKPDNNQDNWLDELINEDCSANIEMRQTVQEIFEVQGGVSGVALKAATTDNQPSLPDDALKVATSGSKPPC